jgi:hypothetical protein
LTADLTILLIKRHSFLVKRERRAKRREWMENGEARKTIK